VLDTYSRRIVGWSIDSSPNAALVTNALSMAIDNRGEVAGTVIHSDQGTQFGSWAFTQRAKASGLLPSMGSVGDCYYNGLMESAQTKGTWAFPLLTSRLDRTEREMRATITGPTCDASDTIFFDAAISADICEGDRVYIGATGAYTLCYASSFNGFPPPTPVYFDGAVAVGD